VNAKFAPELHIGPVLSAGEHSISAGLGENDAAPGLRVPRTIDIATLPPCA
jgi:hypothetical protein